MARAALGWLAGTDVASLPAGLLADCLRGLEHITAVHTAARVSVLAAFTPSRGMNMTATARPGPG